MTKILYYVAYILICVWAIGVFCYGLGGMIHALFVLALLDYLINSIINKNINIHF